jgi:predicted outer membrane repeat protein
MKLTPILILWIFSLLSALILVSSSLAADAVVSGACSEAELNDALNTVQTTGGGTITFDCGNAPFYLYFNNPKTISATVTIDGQNLAVLSGQNVTRLFVVNVGGSLSLQNLTVSNGHSLVGDGGAIFNSGNLTIGTCKVLNNTTESTWSGGAIVSYGPLTIDNSEFAFNRGGNGGAIYPRFAAAVTNIANSFFHDNQATNTTSGWGGALLAWDSAPVTINNTQFTANQAYHSGGALYTFLNSTLIVRNSQFSGNSAFGPGGGLYIQGTAEIMDSEIISNTSGEGGGGTYNIGSVKLNRVQVALNRVVPGNGGGISNSGILELNNSTIYDNRAFAGGGIYTSGTVSILNSTIANNLASYNFAYGGGIYASGSISLNFVTLLDNKVDGLRAAEGPSIYVSGIGPLTAKNTIIKSVLGACVGSIISQGYNIGSDSSCSLILGTDRASTDPQLGPLTFNGGPTPTSMPQPGSPAIDGGLCMSDITTDQRNAPRPKGAACDIGAVEYGALLPWLYLPLISK